MTNRGAPNVECELHHPILAVADVRAAVAFYVQQLGFSEDFTHGEPPTFAGVSLDRVQIFLEAGSSSPGGSSVYFVVGNADDLSEFQRANGVSVVQGPADQDWGLRDYTIRDLDGNYLTFGHRLPKREPPLPVERIDIPVRLEKRLAAVLADLAKHKHMSVSECLEETLLHTFEPLGEGVASPHTKTDLRYIQELKQEHGIDYDAHASYRFIEQP
jgi:catechol 2,3-dioxygenase-like lactoylglutathione lyase family enzyme